MKQNRIDADKVVTSEIRVIYETDDALSEEYRPEYFINWQPLYDLYIVDDIIFISVELPGVEAKDITIYVGQNHMAITGRKKPKIAQKSKDKQNVIFHNLEIAYGWFARTVEFPLPVDARYGIYVLENGVLTIKFPVLKEHIIPIEEA